MALAALVELAELMALAARVELAELMAWVARVVLAASMECPDSIRSTATTITIAIKTVGITL